MLFIRLVVRCLQTNEGERCEQEKKIFFCKRFKFGTRSQRTLRYLILTPVWDTGVYLFIK